MKKIILAFIVLIGISTSCTKDFEDYNTDKKHPTEVPGEMLFSNAQKVLGDQVSSTNVNLNVWKLFSQYWTETTYTDEANYDIVNRTIADNAYRTYYRNCLNDLSEAKKVINSVEPSNPAEGVKKMNQSYIIDLVEAYAYQRLIDTFGDIPYTDALDIENISPVYDDAASIYASLIAKTKAAVAGLDESGEGFGDADLYFAGDNAMWKKFGNSLLIKMGTTIKDATVVSDALAAGPFEMGERCELVYVGGSMSNPLYQDLVQSGRKDFVPANTIIDIMNNKNDPRMLAYFTQYDFSYDKDETTGDPIDTEIPGLPAEGKVVLYYNGGDSIVHADLPFTALAADASNPFTYHVGGLYGESNAYANYSHIAERIKESTFATILLDYTEIAFYLAETDESYYEKAIMSSFDYWQIDGAADYIEANPYSAENLGIQAYLAFYVRGFVGYTSYRRLGFPTTMTVPEGAAESADGAVPRRFTYPINEQTLNGSNRQAAVDAQFPGGDRLSGRIFWDK